uniref:Integrase catalytic domain-containing protein n=1 Tax=Tanacetum cinerariifolium TaxID=118510 RepID=A0A6L2J1T7_TANCI|nr:hypothetical protein [Tanacetum cinerariifolium]
MHKAFPLPVIEFPLAEEVLTASKESCHCQKKREPTAKRIALLVIDFEDSYEVPVSVATTETTSGGTGKKLGRTVTVTTEDMQTRKNDVKARTTLLVSLPDEHQLRIKIEQDDLNQKFLTSLAPEWLMHTIVWRNRSDLDTMSLDDLYNHLKVNESKVHTKSKPNSHNMAFISSAKHSRGNEDVSTASVSTASTNIPTASANNGVASISQDTACAYIASQSSGSAGLLEARTEEGETTRQGSKVEEQALKALMAIDGELETLKKEKEGVDSKLASFLTASKDLDNLIESQRLDKNKEGLGYSVVPPPAQIYSSSKKDLKPNKKPNVRGNQRNWNNLKSHQLGPNFVMKKKACFNYGDFNHLAHDYRKRVKRRTSRSQNITHKSFISRPAFHKSYRPPMRPVRTNMNGARPNRTSFNKPTHSYINRPFQRTSAVRSQYRAPWVPTVNRNFPPVNRKFSPVSRKISNVNRKFPTANRKFPTGGTKFHTANIGKKRKDVKPSACWFWKPSQNLSNKGPNSNSVSVMFKKYTYIDTQGRLKFTWTFFLKTKDETSGILRKFITEIENLQDLKVKIIRCDNGGEFRKKEMNDFCSQKWIKREFSNARTPHQNGVAERRNRTLIKAARTMLADAKLPVTFWAEAVNTACYVQNRVLVNKSQKKTPYELFNDNLGKFEVKGDEGYFIGYSMSSKAFRVFNKRTRRVEENLNVEFLENKAIEKGAGPNWLFDVDSLTKSMNYVPVHAGTNSTNLSGTKDATSQEVKKDVSSLRYIALPNWVHDSLLESSSSKPQVDCSTEVPKNSGNLNPTASTSNPPAYQMETLTVESPIPNVSSPVPTACSTNSQKPSSGTRLILKRVANQVEIPSLDNILTLTNRFEDILGVTTNSDESNGVEADVSNMETTITASPTPTLIIHKDHPKNSSWVEAMQEELLQFKIQRVWTLVDCPKGVRPIGTKWVLKNKKDEKGIVIRNKARLVAQGHTQEEGIDYDEVFASVARIEAIRLFLAYASFIGFTMYQMDVKSAFLYGTIDEEVYVMQPPRFQDPEFPAKVYKVEKAMYGLHQAPRAWHQVTPKECHMHAVKRIFRYLKGHPKLGLWYPKESPFDLVAYSDSDYGGAT